MLVNLEQFLEGFMLSDYYMKTSSVIGLIAIILVGIFEYFLFANKEIDGK